MFKVGETVYIIDPDDERHYTGEVVKVNPETDEVLVGYETDYYYKTRWFAAEQLSV